MAVHWETYGVVKDIIEGWLVPAGSIGAFVTHLNIQQTQANRGKDYTFPGWDFSAQMTARSISAGMMYMDPGQKAQLSHVCLFPFRLQLHGQEPLDIQVALFMSGEYETWENKEGTYPRERLYYLAAYGSDTVPRVDQWGNSLPEHRTYLLPWEAIDSILNDNRIHMTYWWMEDGEEQPRTTTAPQFYNLASALQDPPTDDMTSIFRMPEEEIPRARDAAGMGLDVPDVDISYCLRHYHWSRAASCTRRKSTQELIQKTLEHDKAPITQSVCTGRETQIAEMNRCHSSAANVTTKRGIYTQVTLWVVQETAFGQTGMGDINRTNHWACQKAWEGRVWFPDNFEDRRPKEDQDFGRT